jgi:hypothetical protein
LNADRAPQLKAVVGRLSLIINRMNFLRILIILSLALLSVGCDPGIHYIPKDWAATDGHRIKAFGPVEIQIERLGGLIGDKWLNPEIVIRNRGKTPVVVEKIILDSNDSEYLAKPFYETEGMGSGPP